MRSPLLLSLAVCAGCAGGVGAIDLSISADGTLSGIDHLHVTVANAGQSAQPMDVPLPGAPITLPPAIDVQLRFPKGRSGAVTIHVDALDRNGRLLAAGDTIGDLSPGKATEAELVLRGGVPAVDGGADSAVDLGPSANDLSIAKDLALSMPDMTPSLDQSMLPDLLPPAFTLAATRSYSAGVGPTAIVVGDWNSDGKLDVAVSDDVLGEGAGQASILLGNGDGTLQPPSHNPVGASPESIAKGDFNGDGKLDLVTADRDGNDVSVLLGNGDGTFQSAQPYAAGAEPQAIAVGFLNADRNPDLAVVSASTCEVNILLGNGSGSFSTPATFVFSQLATCFSIAIADLNGDGKADLAIGVHASPGGVGVLLGNGDGTFQGPRLYPSGGAGWTAVIGDANGDGKPDLLSANGDGTIGVLLGNGDGTFQPPRVYAADAAASDVTAGDVNADGHLDVVASVAGSTGLSVLLGNGDGSLQPGQVFGTGSHPYGVAFGDLNGDGKLDLAVANNVSNDVSVLLNLTQ